MQTLPLADGSSLPAFGLGTWLSEPEVVTRAVRVAIELGYRHIDTAKIYDNEDAVGKGIAEAIAAGDVTREELWVTTKLWNDCHAKADVRPALEASLSRLGLQYIDLYLIHWPVALRHGLARPKTAEDYLAPADAPLAETWGAMTELSTDKTRHVGVSNFSAAKVAEVSDAVGKTPAVNQVELHPYHAQNELLASMAERKVVVTAYAPLGSSGRPPGLRREDETRLLEEPTVIEIAKAHEVSPAQVLIAWALARGTSVIPKSTNATRIAENLAATKLVLTDGDRARLDGLDRGARYVDGSFWCTPGSPWTLESLWG